MIPTPEPTLKIGIILPEDERKEIKLSFEDPSIIEIESDSNLEPSCKTPESMIVTLDDGGLVFRKTVNDDPSGIKVHNVPAGRGFHWEKTLDITFPGNIIIKNIDDRLLLVNEVGLEHYLSCVAVSEMSSECPTPFLKAQTIAARSWILAAAEKKHSELNIDACNDDCCQRYQGMNQMTDVSQNICHETSGEVLVHDEKICDARYSKSCGGITENAENVWIMDTLPYLQSVFDGSSKQPAIDWGSWFTEDQNAFCGSSYIDGSTLSKYLGNVDQDANYNRWEIRFSQNEFCEFFSEKVGELVTKIHKIDAVKRGQSGRIIELFVDYQTNDKNSTVLLLTNEYDIRKTLHPSFLYSSCFSITINEEWIQFNGAGWGHGVGLCQIGALGMALDGYSSSDILSHYYIGAEIKKLY